jgi:hemerythrin
MELLRWDETLSVGVSQLDAQHKRMIDMINSLLGSSDEPHSLLETAGEILARMTEYAEEHFDTEESLMAKHGYPGLAQHKEEHIAFRRKTADFCFSAMQDPDAIGSEILPYLREWWTQHILVTDMKYREFFRQRGVL